MRMALVAAAMAATLSTAALAQPATTQDHGGHAAAPAADPAAAALEAVNARMHAAMAIPPSGNPDVDFARSMIPHHQGAIDMARVVLQYGKDPWVKELAQKIIDAQTGEIADMEKWLAGHAK